MRRAALLFQLLAVAFLLLGCGGGGATSTEEELLPTGDAPLVRQLRVDLQGSGEEVRIARARLLSVPVQAVAIPSLGGSLVLVGYSTLDEPTVAVPFDLPQVLRIEGSLDGTEVGQQLPLREASVSLFLDASEPLERIEVLGSSGERLATLDGSNFEAAIPAGSGPGLLAAGSLPGPRSRLTAEFPHIDFLGPDDDLGIGLDNLFSPIEEISEMTEREAEFVRNALNRMPAPAFSAVRTMAVARFARGSTVVGGTVGSTVVINYITADIPVDAERVWVHEATHAYAELVNGGLQVDWFNRIDWPPAVQEAAERTIQDFDLHNGLTRVWNELHSTAVRDRIGVEYLGDDWEVLSDVEADANRIAAPYGFASAYGGKDADEDMAEYVAWLVVADQPSAVCALVRDAGSPFPADRALPYIKAKYLEALGLLTPEQISACMGQPEIEGPPGIHLNDFSLTDGLQAGFIEDGRNLGVFANALPYRMLISVKAPDRSPLGLHRLDNIGFRRINSNANAVLLSHDTEPLRARTSARGLVLVTEFGPERVAGAVFFLSLRNAAGGITDTFSLGTFRVDNP